MLRRSLTVVAVSLLLSGCATESKTSAARPPDCRVDRCVALTFDDGPTPFTDRLIDVLNDGGAKATFFLIGNKVAANPDGARRLADAGMEIGDHTWEHPDMTAIPAADVPAQFARAQDAIAATALTASSVSPPGGRQMPGAVPVAAAMASCALANCPGTSAAGMAVMSGCSQV